MLKYDVYNDINKRTNGEIYIGVVGPVRTGKSTFIKRFMDLMVLPNLTDENVLARTKDELPQSAAGKTIMTTEPKFIPNKAAEIKLNEETSVNVRIIDSVGYMVEGATGHIEDNEERMVKTPWFDYEIPFSKAAEIGTKKVINDHSTIGLVVTCDGSFGELPRSSYVAPERKTIEELKNLGKPFIVLLNSNKPYSEDTKKLAMEISENNGVSVIPVNIAQLKIDDINNMLLEILESFPVSEIGFVVPKWVEMLENTHWLKSEIITAVKEILSKISIMRDINDNNVENNCQYVKQMKILNKDMSNGNVRIQIDVDDSYYFNIISTLTGASINNEYELINTLKELKGMKDEFTKVRDAMNAVNMKGYGVVIPSRDEIILDEPEIIKNGNKFGIKIKAKAPSIHMIKADVLTEIAPIVGSEEQAKDLISFIKANEDDANGIWDTNIFGKTIEQIVNDGISMKINRLSDETQGKMQDTISKITNDSKGGVICIIL
ncbi:MAG: stage IV sporulation protein A [Lachnospiraceae bacterium]|nr:stage IV sporulation protein A [Lachnospiraceae bacterium]